MKTAGRNATKAVRKKEEAVCFHESVVARGKTSSDIPNRANELPDRVDPRPNRLDEVVDGFDGEARRRG